MSTDDYKPLFNRTYLKILLIGSILAVLWLSSLGQPKPAEQGQIDGSPVYWLQNVNPDPEHGLQSRLQVILPTESAFSGAELNRQHWRAAILRERLHQQLENQYSFAVQVADDYLSFSVAENPDAAEPLPDVPALMAALAAPVDASQWQAQLKTVQAERYLSLRDDSLRLLANLADRLGPNTVQPLNWAQLFSQPSFILATENAEQQAQALAEALPAPVEAAALSARPLALQGHFELELSSRTPLLLMAETFAARNDTDFMKLRLIAATSELVLNRYTVASGSHFQLRWKVLQQGSYQAVVFSSEHPLNNAQLEAFRQRITPELVDEARQLMDSRWRNVERNQRWQLNTLSLIARYQLPIGILHDYLQELNALDNTLIVRETRALFDPQQRFSLRVE